MKISDVIQNNLVKDLIKARQMKADAEDAEQAALFAIGERVFKGIEDTHSTPAKIKEHIEKNHQWTKPLYEVLPYGSQTLTWDLLNAFGFEFTDNTQ